MGRSPDETDYALYAKWTSNLGFAKDAVLIAAKKLKRGSMNALDMTLEELSQKGKTDAVEVEAYLTARENLANLTFRLGRKLGVKVQNPAPYIDEYVEKWYTYGFEESSLLDIALFCLKTERGSFECMDEILSSLFKNGVITAEGVKAFLKEKNAELKLFTKLQGICGTLRKSEANLALVKTWKEWNFGDEMILEAAQRSAGSANPLPYINKILSEWKQKEIFSISAIPEKPVLDNSGRAGTSSTAKSGYTNPSIEAANAKSDRERYYALLREKAQTRAEKFLAKANENDRFKTIGAELSKMEISLAKAEVFEPAKLPALQEQKAALQQERKDILAELQIDEKDLLPQFTCKRCQDTGFLPSGAACNCYKA
jgi:hypothetical protein